jgi:O-antigen ligase
MIQEKSNRIFLIIPFALVGSIIIFPGATGAEWGHLNIFSNTRLDLYLEGKANHLGLICGMFAFTTAYLGSQQKGQKRIFYFLFAGACMFLLFRTGARASFIGTIVVFSGWLLWKARSMSTKKKFIFLLAGMIALGGIFYSPLKDNRIVTTVTSGLEHDRSFLERFFIWHVAYKNFLQRPLIGTGFDSFAEEYKAEAQNREANQTYKEKYPYAIPSTNNAHNYFLHFLSETGILGLGAMLWFWFSVIMRAKSKNPAAAPVAGMFLISLIAFQMNMSMYGSQLSTILFAFAGISSYSIKKKGPSEEV